MYNREYPTICVMIFTLFVVKFREPVLLLSMVTHKTKPSTIIGARSATSNVSCEGQGKV